MPGVRHELKLVGGGDKLPVLRTSEYVSGKNILAGIKT